MSKDIGYNPETGKYDYAAVTIDIGGEPTEITWLNSRLRVFINYVMGESGITVDRKHPSPYDHLEIDVEGGQLGAFIDPKLDKYLRHLCWPMIYSPLVDTETLEWKESIECTDINDIYNKLQT